MNSIEKEPLIKRIERRLPKLIKSPLREMYFKLWKFQGSSQLKWLNSQMADFGKYVEGSVVDIGGGPTGYGRQLSKNCVTLDMNPEFNPDILGDIHALPFADNSFDTIICTEVLEHIKNPIAGVRELERALKPGGALILSTPFCYPIHCQQDYWRFTEHGLKMLLSNKWQIVEFQKRGFKGTLISMVERWKAVHASYFLVARKRSK